MPIKPGGCSSFQRVSHFRIWTEWDRDTEMERGRRKGRANFVEVRAMAQSIGDSLTCLCLLTLPSHHKEKVVAAIVKQIRKAREKWYIGYTSEFLNKPL